MKRHSFFNALSSYKIIPIYALCCLSFLAFPTLGQANSIGDFVWEDLNENGIQDLGEPGLPNIPVYLYDVSSNFVEGTSTDANGFYEITNIVNGTYFISLPVPLSFPYFITTNNIGSDEFDSDINNNGQSDLFVFSGVAITNVDAGFVRYVPGIQVTKIASDPIKTAPDGTPLYITNNTLVTYTYIITNTGNSYLSFVALTDDVLFPGGINDDPFILVCPTLFAPGEVLTITTQVFVNASVTNIAEVLAFPVNFKTCDFLDIDPVSDTDDAVVLLVHPGYVFEKTLISPAGRAAAVGENILFTITVNNTGDTDFVSVPVDDTYDTNFLAYVSSVPASVDNVNDGIINWANIGPIAAFSSGTITATFTAVRSTFSQPLTNVAITAPQTATNVPGVPPQTNDAPYEISQPGYTIVKTVSSPAMPAVVGDTITFQVQIVNTGDVILATIPLTDTYDTSFLSYDSSVPASEDNVNDGTINWTNVGPLAAGQLTNIFVSFLAVADTDGFDETNVVVATPTVPPDEPPVPPQTSSVPYEIITPADLLLDKQFISATEPDTNGIFEILYTVTVTNAGEDSGVYYLLDTPVPDPEVTINGGNVTGHTNLTLVGSGPYLLATNETILGGATHVYTLRLDAVLSADVLNGETSVSLCDFADVVPGQGLYNEVLLQFGDLPTVLNAFDCGDVPPFLFLDKSFLGTTDPDALGNFTVTYQITVQNVGGTDGVYDLNDTPDPDPNVSILGGLVTGHSNVTLVGSGPYSIVMNEIIAASATHVYTVQLDAALSSAVLTGSTTVSQCSGGEDDSVAGEGLFNEAVVVYGSSDTAITNDACGDIPPLMVLEKDFISVSDLDSEGNFTVTYTISVLNSGGSAGQYDLNDNPQPDPHVTITGGVVSGYASLLLGPSSPYGLATNEPIAAGVTHVYTVLLYAVVSSDILTGEEDILDCGEGNGTPQAGEGMFNEAVVIYGDDDTTITNDACGDLPPVLVLEKDFLSTTDPDALGNFSVAYTISVYNNGGSIGTYDLTDIPAPDTEITILGGDVTGHIVTNLTGPGPYTIITNESIAAAATHVYTVRLDAVLSADILDGSETVSQCGTSLPQAGEGLFNEAVVDYGNVSITNDACGDAPPFIVVEKDFVSASDPDNLGNFQFEYLITVLNSGGNSGSYDLIDDPSPDANITITNGAVTGHIPQALVGSGPYTLATDEAIGAGVTHVYTVRLNAAFSGDILAGVTNLTSCGENTGTPQPGEALFNVAIVVFGDDDTTITNEACGEPPPLLLLEKDFVSAGDIDDQGNFAVTYVISVQNVGGSTGSYDLNDDPQPDPHVTITGGVVSGYASLLLGGVTPYGLATNEPIIVGATHVYTLLLYAVVSGDVLTGEEDVLECGARSGTPQAGEGLFNEAVVIYGDNDTTITNDACGDLPPILVLEKDFLSTTDPDAQGNFTVTYTISVYNNGGSAGTYDLTDTPAPDPEITIQGGDVTGHIITNLTGPGPYTIITNESIAADATHVYTVRLDAVLSANIMDGSETATACGTDIPQAGEGLFNEAVVDYGNSTITNDACGEIPPFIVIEKDFVSASDADNLGNFQFEYILTVQNSGGSLGSYDLIDDPSPDTNITINSGVVSGHIPQGLPGPGPYNIAIGENIGAGVTHVYTVQLFAVFSGEILSGSTNIISCGETTGTPQPDEALFNIAVVIFGEDDTTITNDACGEAPPFLVIDKEFIEATDPDVGGNFEVEYVVTVKNSGGSSTLYDLTDTPSPDADITINGAAISGHTNLVLLGAGPYTLASGNTILVGETHTYTVRLDATLSADILSGEETITPCGENIGTPSAGESLYNEAEVTYGDDITVTTNACGDVPPFMIIEKDFISSTDADVLGNFSVTYQVRVQNVGGSSGAYNLTDTPLPDPNITINNGTVSGQTNLALVGAGPYLLGTGVLIDAGDTHTYDIVLNAVLGTAIINGVTNATECGQTTGTPQAGEGMFNEAVVTFGDNSNSITNDACGEIPPYLNLDKEFIASSDADEFGNFTVSYRVTVQNSGGSGGNYNLSDTPDYDPYITVTGATVIGQSSQASGDLNGQPIYNRVFGIPFSSGCSADAGLSGTGTNVPYLVLPPIMGSAPGPFRAQTSGGVSDTFMTIYCSFDPGNPTNNVTAANDDGPGTFQSTFTSGDGINLEPGLNELVVSLFTSSSLGTGLFDVTIFGGGVFVDAPLDYAGAGPYEIATNKLISAGVTHVYTVLVYAAYSEAITGDGDVATPCGASGGLPQGGEGLFNQVTLEYGDNDITVTNEACGNPPPFLSLFKNFAGISGPDNLGNITIDYQILVRNVGASTGRYELVDDPDPDPNVTITGAVVSGNSSGSFNGAGPYVIVTNEPIGPDELHTYTVRLFGVMSADLMLGVDEPIPCGLSGPSPGEGLYNRAIVAYGNPEVVIEDDACVEIPDVPYTNIGDTVWIDLNNNGNPDENLAVQGLNNVRVDLYNIVGGVTNFVDFRLTTTNGFQRGYYLFTNLPFYGVYMAQVDISTVPPTVNTPTTPTRYFVPPTGALNADFGFMPGTPTAVDLIEFRAEVFGGQVRLIWETATELDNMGFNLYRASSPDGERSLVNDALVPGRGTGLGGVYHYDDPSTLDDGTYYYWLEDVEYNFSTREHGPLRVTIGAASTVAELGTTFVQNDGVVMITAGTFERSGINLASIDPSRLRTYIDDQEVALYSTAYGSMMKAYDYILVYLDNESGDALKLSVGYSPDGDPLRMGLDFAFVSGDTGDVMTGRLPEDSSYIRLALNQAYVRCLLTGFSDPLIWLFDITNAGQPTLLLGADTISVNGEVGLYFSYPHENTELIAVGAESIQEVDHFEP